MRRVYSDVIFLFDTVKTIPQGTVPGKRKRGRQRKRWRVDGKGAKWQPGGRGQIRQMLWCPYGRLDHGVRRRRRRRKRRRSYNYASLSKPNEGVLDVMFQDKTMIVHEESSKVDRNVRFVYFKQLCTVFNAHCFTY